jgi:dihydrofolate reductase
MIISIIAAMGRNRVIGKDNTLPWKLPADMKRFRDLTLKKPVIMGRKTYESIGHPLSERINIILTKDKNFRADGCVVVNSIEEAIMVAREAKEVMVIGGAAVYAQFLIHADRMYLTLIDHDFEGDAFFPRYNEAEWLVVKKEEHEKDENNSYPYSFVTLERRRE